MRVQASGSEVQVEIVDVDINLARDKMVTPRNHVLNDRRPEEYTDLVSPDRPSTVGAIRQ